MNLAIATLLLAGAAGAAPELVTVSASGPDLLAFNDLEPGPDGLDGAWQWWRATSLYPSDSALVLMTIGDSKSVGASGGTPVTNVLSTTDFVLCQNGASNEYEPLHEANPSNCWPDAETRGSGMVQVYRDRVNPATAIIHVRCGQAGAQLDANFWNADGGGAQALYDPQCLGRIDEAIALIEADPTSFGTTAAAVAAGRAVTILGAGLWIGANSDADAADDFFDDLTALVDAFSAAARSRTGQSFNPPWIVNTPYTWAGAGGETTVTGPVLGAIAAAAAHPDIYLGLPDYPMLGADTLHEAASGARYGAQGAGGLLVDALHGGALEAPLMTAAHQDGAGAWFVFNQPTEIAEGTSTPTLGTGTGGASTTYGCAAHPSGANGLELNADGGVVPTLSNCANTAPEVIRCDIDAPVTGAVLARYAWSGTPATAAFGCQGSSANPHGNIRSPSSLIYAQASSAVVNLDGGGTVLDAGVDAGDAGVDSGVDAGGGSSEGARIYTVLLMDESWADFGSVPDSPQVTGAAYECPDDAGPCAYIYDEPAGAAHVAVAPDASTEAYPTQLANFLAANLWAAGVPEVVALAWDAWPGTRTDSMNTTNLQGWMSAVTAAARAAHPTRCVYPVVYIQGSGGYACEAAGANYATCFSGQVDTFRDEIATAAAGLTGLCSDWTDEALEVAFVAGAGQAWGSDAGFEQNTYSGLHEAFADATHHLCGQFGNVSLGSDDLHPDDEGTTEIAALFAACLARVISDGASESVSVVSATHSALDVLDLLVRVPCTTRGDCANDPPLGLDTTTIAAQTGLGGAVNYGLHLVNDGGLQPAVAPSSIRFAPASECDGGYCGVVLGYDGGTPGDFDELTTCDWALGPAWGPDEATAGACNMFAASSEAFSPNCDGGVCDFLRSSRVAVASIDAGTPDTGVVDGGPDAGPDAGPSDAGTHPEVEARSWTISWSNATCTDTGSGDGVDDAEGVMHLDEDGTFNDLECDFDLAGLGFDAAGLYNHTLGFGLGTNGATQGCLENASSWPGVADEEPFVARWVFLETAAQSTNRYHAWWQLSANEFWRMYHNPVAVNTGELREGGLTAISDAFTGGAARDVGHVLDMAHDPAGIWGPADTLYVCRDGVCESTTGSDFGAIAAGSPFGFGGPFNCSAGIEDMYYAHAGIYIGADAVAEWSPSRHIAAAVNWRTGAWNSTRSLDPGSGHLEIATTSGPLDDLDGITVLAWGANPTIYQPIVSRWGGGGASTEQWWLGTVPANGDNGAIHYEIGIEQGGTGAVCAGDASSGAWQQIGFSWDGANVVCFENGVGSTVTENGTIPASLNDEDQPITIGGTGYTADIDSVSYFSCALTAAEVLRVYCTTHGAGAGACATAGPGSTAVDESDFGTYVLQHPCFLEHCEFEQSGYCFGGTVLSGSGTPAYTTAQP